MSKLLIKNARIHDEVSDILVVDDRIADIRPCLSHDDSTRVIEQSGNLVIPGFVDCHAHIDKSHLNDDGKTHYVHGTGAEKGALTRTAKASFTVEDIMRRAELALQSALHSGTLILRTNCDVDAIVGLKGIEALLRLKEQYRDRITLQIAAFSQEGIFQDGKTPELLEEAMRMGADLVGGHTITCGEGKKHIDFILNLAAKYGTEADFHLDESGNREHYLLPYLAKRMKETDMCGRVNAIHMCTLSALTEPELAEALTLINESRLKVTVAPTAISTRKIAPVKALLQAGISVGLGSDNIRDFFNPLGSGNIRHIALLLSYLQAFYTEEEISAVWNMITTGGAGLLQASYGMEVGGKANLTLLSAKSALDAMADQLPPVAVIRSGKIL